MRYEILLWIHSRQYRKQGEGVSLQEQKSPILAYAAANQLAITDWFEGKETAAQDCAGHVIRHKGAIVPL